MLFGNVSCPVCGAVMYENVAGYYRCDCGFTIGTEVAGHTITPDDMEELMQYGMTKFFQMTSKEGNPFRARLRLSPDKKKVEFDFHSYVPCPKCGQEMRLNNGGLFCDNKECNIRLFRKMFGRELDDKDLISLLTNGITGELRFFSEKKQKPYLARVTLDNDYKTGLVFVNEN